MKTFLLFLGAIITLIFGERVRNEVFASAGIVWEGTNVPLQRYLTFPLLVWVVVCLTASTYRWSDGWFIAVLSIPILVLVTASALWPTGAGMLYVAYNESERARNVIGTIASALAWVMFIVVLLRIIPINNDPAYAAFGGLLICILGLWAVRSGEAYWSIIVKTWGSRVFVVIILIIVAILFMGGRDRAKERAKSVIAEIPSWSPSPSSGTSSTQPAQGGASSANTSAVPEVQLGCNGAYVQAPEVPQFVAIVTKDCGDKADWLVRATVSRFPDFYGENSSEIFRQNSYDDGTFDEWYLDSPLVNNTKVGHKGGARISGCRFRIKDSPVTIRVIQDAAVVRDRQFTFTTRIQ